MGSPSQRPAVGNACCENRLTRAKTAGHNGGTVVARTALACTVFVIVARPLEPAMSRRFSLAWCLVASLWMAGAPMTFARPLAVCTFQVDATPPLGSPLCSSAVPPAQKIVDRLSARGIVLLCDPQPIVLCAVDWVGIGGGGNDAWREALAAAAGTTPGRVAVHTLHQHDAPSCDFDAERLLASRGLSGAMFDVEFAERTIASAAEALSKALANPTPVTHLGMGAGRVEQVASNRRVLGPDGKVEHVRYSSCKDPAVRAKPEGVIDPLVRCLSFWNGERPVAVLTYYATHPQSYYGQGGVSYDFVGMARAQREVALPGVPHLHFNGASGNLAAGKYNDGSVEMRPILAGRLAAGMKAAWEATAKTPITAADVHWRTVDVKLPLRDALEDETALVAMLGNASARTTDRVRAAIDLVWARRVKPIDVGCLRLGPAYVLHMPGELFVEYQLAAAAMKPHATVCMAAYGDYAPGYIGTEVAYSQGGYETGYVSRVAPHVERVLTEAMRELLK
jgi:hypothetical protein